MKALQKIGALVSILMISVAYWFLAEHTYFSWIFNILFIFWVSAAAIILHISFGGAKHKTDGVFIVDTSDPEKDILSIEYDKNPITDLAYQKEVIFKVQRKD